MVSAAALETRKIWNLTIILNALIHDVLYLVVTHSYRVINWTLNYIKRYFCVFFSINDGCCLRFGVAAEKRVKENGVLMMCFFP